MSSSTTKSDQLADRLFSNGCLTPTYKSSRSIHRLFRWDERFSSEKSVRKIKGLEIRLGAGNRAHNLYCRRLVTRPAYSTHGCPDLTQIRSSCSRCHPRSWILCSLIARKIPQGEHSEESNGKRNWEKKSMADRQSIIARARRYIRSQIPRASSLPANTGMTGRFRVACVLVRDFYIPADEELGR